MALIRTRGARIAGVTTCVPTTRFDNLTDPVEFTAEEIRKVSGMAGVAARRMAGDSVCSSDLCVRATEKLIQSLDWTPDSIDALVMVTQTPDYLLPSTSCVIHERLGLADGCAAFDVGLGCSGYPYGLWLAAMMLQTGGVRRALVLHGETPTRFVDSTDRSVSLLFGDAGSATALECSPDSPDWFFAVYTDGSGYEQMVIEAGGFRDRFNADTRKHSVSMDGAAIFNFTIKRVPRLIEDSLRFAEIDRDAVDYFLFHQANQFILKHLIKKAAVPIEKAPIIMREYGNTGGVSVPMALTLGGLDRPADRALRTLLLGYGVGLSWGSALVDLDSDAILDHVELENTADVSA